MDDKDEQQRQEQVSTSSEQQQHKRRKQQNAISRFPSNIDAHLSSRRSIPQFQPQQHNSPNPISNHPVGQQQQQQQQQQQANRSSPSPGVQMAYQDAWRVCHPDHERPFSSLQDACQRLLPYHVLADYEVEEEDRLLDSDTTGRMLSRSQQWEQSLAAKVAEFTETFEKQVFAFNIISRKRALGEFRTEERLMLEHNLAQEGRQSLIELRAQMHSRQQADRMAAMVHAEQSRADMHAHADGMAGGPIADQEPEGSPEDEKEPSEDFLNDEETENGDSGVGEFDLNSK